MAKKATLGTIGKSLDCIAKNTCEKIDLSEITSGIEDVVSKLTENNTILTNIHSAVDGLENITEEIKNELKNQTTVITNKFNKNIAKINEVKNVNRQTYNKVAEVKNYVDNVETLLTDIKNNTDEDVDLTPVTNLLTQIKSEIDQVEEKLDEIIGKPEETEIVGCIEMRYKPNNKGVNTIAGKLYGVSSKIVEGVDNKLPNSDVVILYANEDFLTISDKVITERYFNALKSIGLNPSKKLTKAGIGSYPSFNVIWVVADVITDTWEDMCTISNNMSGGIPVYYYLKSPASLVKSFDKQGIEITSKRKYYNNGTQPVSGVNFSLDCKEEPTKNEQYKPFHKLVENGVLIKPMDTICSVTFTVIEGEANVTIDGVTIKYPTLGGVIGSTYDGKIGSTTLQGEMKIETIGSGKVLVTGIKKA